MNFFLLKLFFFLSVLLVSSNANPPKQNNPYEILNQKQTLGPHEVFGNPYGNPNDYKDKKMADDIGTPMDGVHVGAGANAGGSFSVNSLSGDEPLGASDDAAAKKPGAAPAAAPGDAPAAEPGAAPVADNSVDLSGLSGNWELASNNSGVSAMHLMLLPIINKVLMFDSTIWRISAVKLPNGTCRLLNKTTGETDCFAHSVLYDIETAELSPLELNTDTWCSSGGLLLDGNLVSTGGFQGGANTVRYLVRGKEGGQWKEYPTALAAPRWYSTQITLPDDRFVVFGGRDAHSFEYIPQEGKSNAAPINFPFLTETTDRDENNLYPFVFLSTDGNIFVFANNRSVLVSPKTNTVVRELPVLPGGHRNYPASGLSVLLPIKLQANSKETPIAEVLVCGGSAQIDSLTKADRGLFYTALQDCGRIRITDPKPIWTRELMPSPRVMGDGMILPTGDVLMLNGAKRGASGWGFARDPNFVPVLYKPGGACGKRFTELKASTIPRMYHSTSAVLPDGKVLVAGSNTNNGYIYNAMYPTELRVEKFSPPYLDESLKKYQPEIENVLASFSYAAKLEVKIKLNEPEVKLDDLMVTMYAPAFTTHGVSMNQRLLILGLEEVNSKAGSHTIVAATPQCSTIAPPGYYMLFVVYRGVPGNAKWVQIKN